jgi:hypothetical protein
MAPGPALSNDRHPRELLSLAGRLVGQADPHTAGLWPRAAALLGCRAVEVAAQRLWSRSKVDLHGCSMRVQLVCLRLYLGDPDLAFRASHAWAALRRACHHHPYELAPTAGELRGWLSVVGELVQKTD